MSFYTSWGQQASFTDRRCPLPDVYVESLGVSHYVARCRSCDWRTRICDTLEAASTIAGGHAGRVEPAIRPIRSTREVRTALGIERWPTRAPAWAKALVGLPTLALDDLSRADDLIRAALRDDAHPPDEPTPNDTGGVDLAALHAAWAVRATDPELENAAYWVENRPRVAELPLRPEYTPELHRFLRQRARVRYEELKGDRFALIPSGLLQDAGYVARLEIARRERKPMSARRQLRMIVAGLRSKYAVTDPENDAERVSA
jgi:hypothetical protein